MKPVLVVQPSAHIQHECKHPCALNMLQEGMSEASVVGGPWYEAWYISDEEPHVLGGHHPQLWLQRCECVAAHLHTSKNTSNTVACMLRFTQWPRQCVTVLTMGRALESARSRVLLPAFGAPTKPTSAKIFSSSCTRFSSPGRPCSLSRKAGLHTSQISGEFHKSRLTQALVSANAPLGEPTYPAVRAMQHSHARPGPLGLL